MVDQTDSLYRLDRSVDPTPFRVQKVFPELQRRLICKISVSGDDDLFDLIVQIAAVNFNRVRCLYNMYYINELPKIRIIEGTTVIN